MSREYYAIDNTYGIHTVDSDGDRIGYVKVFDSAKKRDEWVQSDPYEGGNVHYEAIPSSDAKRLMAKAIKRSGYMLDVLRRDGLIDVPSDVDSLSIAKITECYDGRFNN